MRIVAHEEWIRFEEDVAIGGISTVTATTLGSEQRTKVEALRNLGKTSLSLRRYTEAIKFYSAVLQLVEGISGDECFELRKRCGLTLAECEIRSGEYERAIARCTEVIEESTNYSGEASSRTKIKESQGDSSSESIDLQKTLCMAHYRRGKAFKKLKLMKLAWIDFKLALKYLPSDKQCLKQLELLEKLGREDWDERIMEEGSELQDYAEDCQVSHPRLRLKKSQLKALISSQQVVSSHSPFSMGAMDGGQIPFGNMGGGLGGLGGGLGGLGALGGMGGLGDMMKGLTGNKEGMKMVLQLGGVSEKLAGELVEIWGAVSGAYKKMKAVVDVILKWKEIILVIGTMGWIIFLARNGYLSGPAI